MIEITGAHELEASDRAILNLLYQHAHDSGRMGEQDAEWSISLGRLRPSLHESNDRLPDSLKRIIRVVVTVPIPEPQTGEPAYLLTHLFDFFTLPFGDATGSFVRFGLPRKLQPILARSNRWGRIKAEIVCAMTSKYAIAVYELVCLRANLDRRVETFPVERFRDLLGVPPGAYSNGKDFRRFVIEPAMLEVNGLSGIGVKIEMKRRHVRAPIEAITVAWWKKEGDEFRATMRERDHSKIGRMARLKGAVPQARMAPYWPVTLAPIQITRIDCDPLERPFRGTLSARCAS
jgi:Initiator Replication protein